MKKHERKQLDATMKKVAEELVLKGITGKTETQIAEEYNINRSTLYRWKMRQDFNDYLQERADQHNRSFLSDAFSVLQRLLNSDNEKTQIKAVELMLRNQGRLKDVQEATVEVKDERSVDDILKDLGI